MKQTLAMKERIVEAKKAPSELVWLRIKKIGEKLARRKGANLSAVKLLLSERR